MRVVKTLVFYIVFCGLCAGLVLFFMHRIAVSSGREGLFQDWMGEIREAFREAEGFVGECRGKLWKLQSNTDKHG